MNGGEVIRLRYLVERAGFALDVDAALPMQGITGVFGASGAGKTTLLRCIAGLESAADARLEVAGTTWEDRASGTALPVHDRSIGYVFQEPRLFDHLSVRANIEYGIKRRGANSASTQAFGSVVEVSSVRAAFAGVS